ncbi:MAG: aminomethyl-transferring glycine dehydrogenase subunit GcvPA [Pseudomonadota bacterium]
MPFIPHTPDDVTAMLGTIGVKSIDDLFDEIPARIRAEGLKHTPEGLSEMAVTRLMRERAARDEGLLCFLGAGAYEHHVPAAVWEIATRGEFYTAYTPYQAEASQGTLQVIYEYQSMIAHLTGMDVSNASVYDGGSGLSEAVLMAVRAHRKSKSKQVLVLGALNPRWKRACDAIVSNQDVGLVEVPFDAKSGVTALAELQKFAGQDFAGIVVAQPNFFGRLEDVDAITDFAHAQGWLVIAAVNPTSLAVLKAPGQWGAEAKGADIVIGDGQPLGIPLASGGPYFGFMCCKMDIVRNMPGRIIGRTVDLEGKPGFVLTLQAREQHIRRAKATSNICTNQGLAMTAATVYMSLMGAGGLEEVASISHANTRKLVTALAGVKGVTKVFDGPYFHEAVIRLPKDAAQVLAQLADKGILGGYALGRDFPQLKDCVLVCATETRTDADIEKYRSALAAVLA